VLARHLDVFRPPVGIRRSIRTAQIAELAGDHVLLAPTGDGLGRQFFVAASAVGIARVDQVDPEFGGAPNRQERLVPIGRAVDSASFRHSISFLSLELFGCLELSCSLARSSCWRPVHIIHIGAKKHRPGDDSLATTE
jgi:hypothetical protein